MLYYDLHGLNEEEAIQEIEMAILSFEMNEYEDEMEIVTGHGTGRIKAVVEDILYEYGFAWHHRNNNTGAYIVTK
ncbi:Smr/MutS family protein [Mycoplasma todarodis]|uniref:Smr/MutS family protein n=1 Tax=Mycoplasma todarodis TaxID=1937191 RepID=UPI003B29BA57